MPIVKAFKIPGLKCWFWSNDHEPPHFHATRDGEWEVRVFFMLPLDEMIEIEWNTKAVSSAALKQLSSLTLKHRSELLLEWEKVRGSAG